MKRRIAVLLAIALLLSLSACGDDPVVGDPPLLFTKPTAEEDPTEPSNIVPTQVPTVAPTAAPTQEPTAAPTVIPTEPPTEPPTEEPTEPPTVYPIDMDAIRAYSAPPAGYMAFRYGISGDCAQPNGALDQGNMVNGYFYGIEDGKEYLITKSHVGDLLANVTSEHVYYVTQDEPGKVYRTDLHGKEHTIVYELAQGTIFCIDYVGVDEKGELYVGVKNDAGKDRIDIYNIATGTTRTFLEAAEIARFAYVMTDYDPYTGPILRWTGNIDGTEGSGNRNYHYVATGMNLDYRSIPTVENTKQEPVFHGYGIYDERTATRYPQFDWTGYENGGLFGTYYENSTLASVYAICYEPVLFHEETGSNAYFMKASEPDAIYVINKYTQETKRYVSEYGKITGLAGIIGSGNSYGMLGYVADGGKLVYIDTRTDRAELYLHIPFESKDILFQLDADVYQYFANSVLNDFYEIVFYAKISTHCEYAEYLLNRDSGVVRHF